MNGSTAKIRSLTIALLVFVFIASAQITLLYVSRSNTRLITGLNAYASLTSASSQARQDYLRSLQDYLDSRSQEDYGRLYQANEIRSHRAKIFSHLAVTGQSDADLEQLLREAGVRSEEV